MKSFVPGYIKTKNRMLVFDLFRSKNRMSRAEIARETGMSFTTVLKVVDKLLALRILTELAETEELEGAGRKGHLLRFNPRAFLAVSAVLEGNIASVGLVDLSGNCLERKKTTINVFEKIPDLTRLSKIINGFSDIARDKYNSKVLGVCIGFPTVVNPETKTILRIPSLGILEELHFEELFPKFCKNMPAPYCVENDVNLACEGEAFILSKEQPCENLLYISLGTGCGAGILLGGSLWRGMRFKSGEIGDLLMTPDTPKQPVGSFERLINIDAINQKFGIDLSREANLPKEKAEQISAYICPYLGWMLANLSNVLDINKCVVTGVIPQKLGKPFYQKLEEEFAKASLNSDGIEISPHPTATQS